ncbi:aminoglycoside phosphotransferase family protein [Streptomyces sp. NPDC056169]|uniref:aminoglycoside phosphotransferase family protein n=1 Tax=Streptomyces sp. NPDC056169 TaxID=3345734 RepID=UPI0035DA1417
MDATALYAEALTREDALAGFYNRNVRMETDSGPVLVRIPGSRSEQMDLTLWSEPAVLEAIRPYVSPAPRLLHADRKRRFQIHEFVEGRRVDEVAQGGKPLPDVVLDRVEQLFREMLRVPSSALPPVPADWPADGDTPAFAGLLLDLVREIRSRTDAELESFYAMLGVPADPCGPLEERAARELAERPFGLLHADIHRKNMIITERADVVFLDWELALWGDPVYDLADLLHKSSCTTADRQRIVTGWTRAAPAECRRAWQPGLAFYLAYEEMKSAVVDTVRWGRRIARAETAPERRGLAEELRAKLVAAYPQWGGGPPPPVAEIEDAATVWLGRARQ